MSISIDAAKKLLIIDDDPAARDRLQYVLSDPDYTLTFASSAADGLAKAAALLPDAATPQNPLDYTALLWDSPSAISALVPVLAGDPPANYDGYGIIFDDSNSVPPALGTNDKQGVAYTGRTYIANNIVHDNGGRGIHVYSSQHVDIVNNTAWNNLLSPSDYIQSGEIDALRSSDVKVVNNVATNLVGKPVTIDAEGNQYEYNLWDGRKVPYKGSNDLVAEAQLTDPANGNFAPRAGSPALRSGTSALAPADDFFGNLRPTGAVDRGAVQISR